MPVTDILPPISPFPATTYHSTPTPPRTTPSYLQSENLLANKRRVEVVLDFWSPTRATGEQGNRFPDLQMGADSVFRRPIVDSESED